MTSSAGLRRVAAIGVVATCALLVACAKRAEPRAEPSVAQVGDRAITADMLARRGRQIDIYYPGQSRPDSALAQLIQGYLAVELLRREGIDLDRRAWIAERDRIERDTRDRDRLEQIKAIYADDEEAYLRVGILPDFARSRLLRHHRATARFGEPARAAAAALLDEVAANPATFAARAEVRGAAVTHLIVDPSAGLRPVGADAAPPDDAAIAGDRAAAARLIALLVDLPPGHVHPRTLETPDSFDAVRLVRRHLDGSIEVELAAFARPDFDAWFWTQAHDVPVAIYDDALRATFLAQVGWSRKLTLAPAR